MKKGLIFFLISLLLFTSIRMAKAVISEGPLADFFGSLTISNDQPAPGETVILNQQITNNSSQTLAVDVTFSLGWGINEVDPYSSIQNGSCDGVLSGVSFSSGYGMSEVSYSSTEAEFPPGEIVNCRCEIMLEPETPVGKPYSYSGSIGSSQGGVFSKEIGNGTFVVSEPVPSPPATQADLNGDKIVNLGDIAQVLNKYGSSCSGCPEDINQDGTINLGDLSFILQYWGESYS